MPPQGRRPAAVCRHSGDFGSPTATAAAPGPYAAPVTIDVTRARLDTPGCAQVVHLNNAGAALPPRPVTAAVVGHLEREADIGGYEAADEAAGAIEHTYDAIARMLGCAPAEIALNENATRAWDMAFYSLAFAPGDRILTSRAEYASNAIAFLQVCRRSGAVVEVIDDDADGQVDVADLSRRLASGPAPVRLVAVTHVPTQGGLVNPAAEIGQAARAAGVPFLLDACQSAGQLPLDVTELGCDMLSATGRKYLRGPRGTGFLYVSGELAERLEPPLLDLWSATWTEPGCFEISPGARRFESWEASVAGRIGLGVAVDYALAIGLHEIEARVGELAARLRAELAALPGVTVHDRGRRRCGIVSFAVDGVGAAAVRDQLSVAGINVNVTKATSAQFDLPARGLSELVRASVHYYNTDEELDQLCRAVRSLS
jgi:cysteine desulfurase / selenocysteine lyase